MMCLNFPCSPSKFMQVPLLYYGVSQFSLLSEKSQATYTLPPIFGTFRSRLALCLKWSPNTLKLNFCLNFPSSPTKIMQLILLHNDVSHFSLLAIKIRLSLLYYGVSQFSLLSDKSHATTFTVVCIIVCLIFPYSTIKVRLSLLYCNVSQFSLLSDKSHAFTLVP